MSEKILKCIHCNYTTNKKYNLQRHVNKVHSGFEKVCLCGKKYTTKSGYKRHVKKCYEILKYEKENLKNDLLKIQEKEYVQNITNHNNTTNISINLYLDQYCSEAKNLTDFIDNLKYSVDDVMNTYYKGYTNGITNVVLKGLEDMPVVDRPIHCTNKKEGKLFIRDNNQWEEDNVMKKGKAFTIISKMRKKQYLAMQEWDKEHPNWEKDEKLSVMRCNILKELLGDDNVEKNMTKILKDVSKLVQLKP